jgi:hypothetical protein
MLPFALAIAAGAAGITVMLSGYLTGGELGLSLAGAIGGAAVAALGLRMLRCNAGVVGVGMVSLFAVLTVGRFFGELRTVHAAILLFAPLLVCMPELLPSKVTSGWIRSAFAVVLFAIPLAFVVLAACDRFAQQSAVSSKPGEASDDDYSGYK